MLLLSTDHCSESRPQRYKVQNPPEKHLRAADDEAERDGAGGGACVAASVCAPGKQQADNAADDCAGTEQDAEVKHKRISDEGARKLDRTILLRGPVSSRLERR